MPQHDAPIIRFVNKIILDAIRKNASDIHIEPYEHEFRIRYRKDGQLYTIAKPAKLLSQRIITRIKVMTGLDISEQRLPQDGRYAFKLNSGHTVYLRVSTCPTLFGEKIVLRLLSGHASFTGFDKLGMPALQQTLFLQALQKTHGLILVTGPTGSGKTVTLYSALKLLNQEQCNIITIEDPVEIHLSGINQVTINQDIGLNFASTLRSFLRQDPDIIMIGEMRDAETSDIALKAAQTGHLVLATLHTNDAISTIARLLTMGLDATVLAQTLQLIIAQRLVKTLCPHCKRQEEDKQFVAVGCDRCHQGYQGRTGIYEVFPITHDISELIRKGAPRRQIESAAKRSGWIHLGQSAKEAVTQGLTSFDAVAALIHEY